MMNLAHVSGAIRCLPAAVAVAGVVLVGGALPASATPIPTTGGLAQPGTAISPATDTQCAGGVCIKVVGSGLFVDSATVTNQSAPTGKGKIINVDAQVTHVGPSLRHGQTFTVFFNRDVKSGDLICGQVGSSSVPCVTITP